MTATTAKTKTTAATKPKAAKPKPAAPTVSHAKSLPPPQTIAEVQLIPLDRIEVRDQVRRMFDEENIDELAADIEARGLRVPVEVTPIGDERYLLTMGERRLRAIQKLGHKAIPALIVPTSENDRLADQLAENIQREALELRDETEAVAQMLTRLGTVAAVAKYVNKSEAWVSKRAGLAMGNIGHWGRMLLDNSITADVEVLNVMKQIERACSWNDAKEAYKLIEGGMMNREQARDYLKEKKTARREQDKKADAKAEKQRHEAEKQKGEQDQEYQEGRGDFVKTALDVLYSVAKHDPGTSDAGNKFTEYNEAQRRELWSTLTVAASLATQGTPDAKERVMRMMIAEDWSFCPGRNLMRAAMVSPLIGINLADVGPVAWLQYVTMCLQNET